MNWMEDHKIKIIPRICLLHDALFVTIVLLISSDIGTVSSLQAQPGRLCPVKWEKEKNALSQDHNIHSSTPVSVTHHTGALHCGRFTLQSGLLGDLQTFTTIAHHNNQNHRHPFTDHLRHLHFCYLYQKSFFKGWNRIAQMTVVHRGDVSVRVDMTVWIVNTNAWKSSIRRFGSTEKAPTRAFSWLKAATTAFIFKTLLRHYAKRALTPRSLNVNLGPQRS